MRVALYRARKNKETAAGFSQQQNFDRAVASLAQSIPMPAEAQEWFVNEKLVAAKRKRNWRKIAVDPAVVAVGLAFIVLVGLCVHFFLQHLNDFPGSDTARKLLTVAASTRLSQLEPVRADAGDLNDLFFMKYRLEHYDVPPPFAQLRVLGYRIVDDEAGGRAAQIEVAEKRMQLFLFPAPKEKSGKGSGPADFKDWRFVEQEGWTGAVQQRSGVYFMAAVRGPKKLLTEYLRKQLL